MRIGNKDFDFDRHCYVMGILNVTPDSFSDGGKWTKTDAALRHVEEMLEEGMDILDIGGESTRPGYTMISAEEETDRVIPVLEAVKGRFDVPVSLDTYKSEVARAGVQAGADIINDIWGFRYDHDMAAVVSGSGVCCVLMHNRKEAVYDDFLSDVARDLGESIGIARAAGIPDEKIILDPGIGFGKTYENNLELTANLQMLKELGFPVLLGTSRKSMIGLTLDLPADEREEGTLVTTVFGVLKGCGIVRVHDVKKNKRAIRMAEALRDHELHTKQEVKIPDC